MRSDISSRAFSASLVVAVLMGFAGCSSSDSHDESMAPPPMAGTQPMAGDGTMGGPMTGGFAPPAGMGSMRAPMAPVVSGQQDPGSQEVMDRQRAMQQRQQEIAQHYVQLGDRYNTEGRLSQALTAYANALKVDPSNADAQARYQRMAGLLGETEAAIGSEAAEGWQGIQARLQQASVLAADHMRRGRHFYSEGDYQAAIEEFQKAQIILEANPNVDSEFNDKGIAQALDEARSAKDRAEREAEANRIREVEAINREKDLIEQRKVETRINQMWERALDLFEREKFADAEKLAGEIIVEDFNHPNARKLKEAARIARHHKANADNISNYREEWQRVLEELKDAGLPQTDTVTFPNLDTWRKVSARGPIQLGSGTTAVSEIDEEVMRRLEGTTLASVDWTDKTLDEAIRFIRNNTGTNIVVMRAVDEVTPPEERILTLSLVNEISALMALRLATNQLNLRFMIEDGIVKITTPEQVRKNKVVEFYEVRDLTAQLNNFPGVELNLNPSGFGAGVGGFDEDFDGDDGEELRTIEVDRLIELIRTTVDAVSWDEDPDNTIVDKNGTLVVRQTPQNQRAIRRLLSDLRKSAGIEVQIEARFISVENNFLQDIGVDFRGLGDNSGGVGTPGLGGSQPFDDFGTPGALPVLGTDNSAGAYYNFGGGNGDIRGRTQNLFDVALGNPDVLTSAGGFSMQYVYLGDTQLEAILRAVQKYERVNEVTAPTLLVHNTQRANLQVTNEIAYVKDFDVEIAQASVVADPIVDVIREGVVLDVRPIVSNDRRFITLELRPSVARVLRPIRTFSTSLGTGAAVTFEVPELKKESLKTTVVMPDGGTLLLGGLKFYEEQDLDSGVPILKDIPIINFFFSRKGKYTNLRDLIILLRVKILIMEEHEPGR